MNMLHMNAHQGLCVTGSVNLLLVFLLLFSVYSKTHTYTHIHANTIQVRHNEAIMMRETQSQQTAFHSTKPRSLHKSPCGASSSVCVCGCQAGWAPEERLTWHDLSERLPSSRPWHSHAHPGTHTHTLRYIECSQRSWQHQSNQSGLPNLSVTSSDDFL